MRDYANPGASPARHGVSPQLLEELERQRRVARARFLKTVLSAAAIACGGGFGIPYAVVGSFSDDALIGVAVGATLVTLIAAALSQMYFQSYRKNFRTQVVAGLVQSVASGLRHKGEEGVPKTDYDTSLLFLGESPASSFRSEDLIEGTAHGSPVRFSEAQATRTWRSGGKRRSETVFHGVLGRVQMAHAVAESLVLIPRKRSKDQSLPGTPELLAFRVGDAAFDQAYAVYGTRPDAVRPLVTPELCNELLAIARTKARANLRVSLVQDGLYFSFAKNGHLLEPPWFTSLEKVDLGELVEDVQGIVKLAIGLGRRLTPGRASA